MGIPTEKQHRLAETTSLLIDDYKCKLQFKIIGLMKALFTIFILVLMLSAQGVGQNDAPSFKWPGKYRAAVCLTYDDGLDCHLDLAAPALDLFGMKGTFYCTGSSPSLHRRLNEWRALAKNGHELGNHSLFHPCDGARFDWVKPEYDFRTYTISQIKNELYTANTLLSAVDGKQERTYAYTCSDFKVGGQIFIDSIRPLFYAARSDGPIPGSIQDIDLHFAPSWGVVDPSGTDLINYVKKAEEKGTIAVFMFHSVGGGYLNVSTEAHNELLSYLSENKNEIWTATFIDVMRYIREHR
jgi:sialate O-acetylesterase